MIEPQLSGEALLNDIRNAESDNSFHLWWLGQSGFLLKTSVGCVLFDPYLSDSLTKKYAATDKPHVRMTQLAIEPQRLDMVDVITSTHNHTDHLDAETILPLLKSNPGAKLLIPEANRSFVCERLGCEIDLPIGLDAQQTVEIGGFRFHGIAAAHNELEYDDAGHCKFLGYVACWGDHAIYHAGDTLWHDELVPQLSSFQIDVALLPINGRLPTRRVAGNLWGQEAATLAKTTGTKLVVPCHYDMFTFNTESPHAFEARCKSLDQPYRLLSCGERLTI